MTIERQTLPAQPYLFVACECPMDGPAIAQAMGQGFQQIMGFAGQNGITPTGMPMSIYHAMPADGKMTFQCAIPVTAEDAARARAPVEAASLPAGEAMVTTHVGPYSTLNQTHGALWEHMKTEGIEPAMPVWEIYMDDPGTTPEAKLRTRIHRAIAG